MYIYLYIWYISFIYVLNVLYMYGKWLHTQSVDFIKQTQDYIFKYRMIIWWECIQEGITLRKYIGCWKYWIKSGIEKSMCVLVLEYVCVCVCVCECECVWMSVCECQCVCAHHCVCVCVGLGFFRFTYPCQKITLLSLAVPFHLESHPTHSTAHTCVRAHTRACAHTHTEQKSSHKCKNTWCSYDAHTRTHM